MVGERLENANYIKGYTIGLRRDVQFILFIVGLIVVQSPFELDPRFIWELINTPWSEYTQVVCNADVKRARWYDVAVTPIIVRALYTIFQQTRGIGINN